MRNGCFLFRVNHCICYVTFFIHYCTSHSDKVNHVSQNDQFRSTLSGSCEEGKVQNNVSTAFAIKSTVSYSSEDKSKLRNNHVAVSNNVLNSSLPSEANLLISPRYATPLLQIEHGIGCAASLTPPKNKGNNVSPIGTPATC